MGMNTILMLIAGIVMSTMVATQVAPSIIESVKTTKVQTQTINNQEVIFEAIKRYTTMKQVAPTSIAQLISANYIDAKVNDNGFGGTYTINVDKALGVATITTTIADPKVQEAFLNSFTGTSKPTRVGTTNNFQTKFVLPNEVMHGNALLMTGIPIQATPPDSNINKYWYDTSSGKATLKLYSGASWIEVNGGGEANTYTYKPGKYIIASVSTNVNIYIPYDGTITTTVSLTAGRDGDGESTCRKSTSSGRVYINNVAVGSALSYQSICSTTKAFNQNFNIKAGDTIKAVGGPLQIKISNPISPTPY